MNKKFQLTKYLVSDILSSGIVWVLFFVFRKIYIEPLKFGYQIPVELDLKFYAGLVFIPLFWVFLYYMSGYYKDIYRKSRLIELGQTLFITVIGVLLIFFALILDDTVSTYKNYYFSFFTLLGLQFIISYTPRLIITTRTNKRIQNRVIGFNTIIIGSNARAVELYEDFASQKMSYGNKFIGFISISNKNGCLLGKHLDNLGSIDDLRRIVDEYNIEEVLIAMESSEHEKIWKIINKLQDKHIIIKVIPAMYDILTGSVKMSAIYGTPLIQISYDIMPMWQKNFKRVIDAVVSAIAMIILIPVYIFLAIGVKMSSKGPILYSHERIGRYGKPFTIYKFRSMGQDAEKNGPALSSKEDNRITPFGKFMRKSRMDEFPQFYNVLIGDMSLVGPRPERQFFIDQIIQIAPHYLHLHKVRPGITSWGQVKYGYAENVEQMIERLKYDIIYLENMSLYLDFKILIYTVKTVVQGSGK
ncbi:MAG: sugar transferase [Bacteroidia bacterium]|nr:sugar transferase [Bacteroidia bacterium]